MVCVGGSVAVSSVLAGAPVFTAEAVRYGAACLLLVALARLTGRRITWPREAEWLWLSGIAVTGLVVFNLALVEGSRHAEPAVLGVAVACVPAVLALVGPVLEGTRPRTAAVAAALTVTCGAGLVQGFGRTDAIGVAWAVAVFGCEAAFTLLAIPVLGRHGPWGVSVHATWLATVMFAVLGATNEGPHAVTKLDRADWLAVGYLAVAVTAAAFVLWYSSVRRLGASRAGLLTGIAPVAAAVSGVLLGGPAPRPLVWAGIAVVAAGLALGFRKGRTLCTSSTPLLSGATGAAHDREDFWPRFRAELFAIMKPAQSLAQRQRPALRQPRVVGLLVRPGLPGPSPVPGSHHRAALVRVDSGGGQARGDRAVVQAVRQEHQVGGEPVAAHVRGLPHRPGMPGGQRLRQRPAQPRAAHVPLAVRADQVQRVIHPTPNDGMIPAASSFRSRSASSGADADTCAYRSQGASPAVQPRNTDRTSPTSRRPGRRINLHPHAELLRRLHQRRQRRGLRGAGRLVRPGTRVLDQQPGPGRLRRRRHRGLEPRVAVRAVLANSDHAGQPPITIDHVHAR